MVFLNSDVSGRTLPTPGLSQAFERTAKCWVWKNFGHGRVGPYECTYIGLSLQGYGDVKIFSQKYSDFKDRLSAFRCFKGAGLQN